MHATHTEEFPEASGSREQETFNFRALQYFFIRPVPSRDETELTFLTQRKEELGKMMRQSNMS